MILCPPCPITFKLLRDHSMYYPLEYILYVVYEPLVFDETDRTFRNSKQIEGIKIRTCSRMRGPSTCKEFIDCIIILFNKFFDQFIFILNLVTFFGYFFSLAFSKCYQLLEFILENNIKLKLSTGLLIRYPIFFLKKGVLNE